MATFERNAIERSGKYEPGKVNSSLKEVKQAFELDKEQGTRGRALKTIIQVDGLPAF